MNENKKVLPVLENKFAKIFRDANSEIFYMMLSACFSKEDITLGDHSEIFRLLLTCLPENRDLDHVADRCSELWFTYASTQPLLGSEYSFVKCKMRKLFKDEYANRYQFDYPSAYKCYFLAVLGNAEDIPDILTKMHQEEGVEDRQQLKGLIETQKGITEEIVNHILNIWDRTINK